MKVFKIREGWYRIILNKKETRFYYQLPFSPSNWEEVCYEDEKQSAYKETKKEPRAKEIKGEEKEKIIADFIKWRMGCSK